MGRLRYPWSERNLWPANEPLHCNIPSMSKVLSVTQLCKTYGEMVAVDGISFDVGRNEIVGLLGPNGAGKTTTINMILGVLEPASGAICIEGIDIATHRSQVLATHELRRRLRSAARKLDGPSESARLRPLYGVKDLAERMEALLQQFDLEKFRNVKCGVLSSGEQTRVCLAKAMLNRSAPPSAGRADGIARSRNRARHPHQDPRVCRTGHRRRACGPRTTCMRWRTFATACFSSRTAGFCSRATRRPCRASTARQTLEELFITVAREPLTLEVE